TMTECPACRTSSPADLAACPQCGLATALYDPIRQAVSLPEHDPRYLTQVQEFLDALGDLAIGTHAPGTSPALSKAGRFPSGPAGAGPGAHRPRASLAPHPIAELPPAGSSAELRTEVREFLKIGRRLGLESDPLVERARHHVESNDPSALEQDRKDLFLRLSSLLGERLDVESGRREEIATYLATKEIDAGIAEARKAFASGNLDGAQRSLAKTADAINLVGEQWGAVEILLSESDALAQEITELGGDPAPAIGPTEEGRRLAREGQRDRAEEVLVRGIIGLWTVLSPRLERDLSQRVAEVAQLKELGAERAGPVADLRAFARRLHERDYVAALEAYRRAGAALAALLTQLDPAGRRRSGSA
ncbi:MAG: hypothetical protein L3J93_06270, partial [Thermoplasmata archaeon]|nr:hypothetical protein [Thermoplasmata archaeon]